MAFCAVVLVFFEALYGFFVYGAAGSLPGGGKRGFAEAQKEQKAGNGGRTKKKNNERCRKSSAENPFRGSNGQTVQRAVCAPPTAWRERRRNGKCDETRLKVWEKFSKIVWECVRGGPVRIPFNLRKSRLLSGRRYMFAVFLYKIFHTLKGVPQSGANFGVPKNSIVSVFICFPFFALAFGVGAGIGCGGFLLFIPPHFSR